MRMLRGGKEGASLKFPVPGSAQAGLTARSGRQVNFSFKGNGIGRFGPDAACIPSRCESRRGAGGTSDGPVAMLLRTRSFSGSGHPCRDWAGKRLKPACRPCRGCEQNVGNPLGERCGAARRSCRTARTPSRGLDTQGIGTPVEQKGLARRFARRAAGTKIDENVRECAS